MAAKYSYSSTTSLFHLTIFFEDPPRLMYAVYILSVLYKFQFMTIPHSFIQHFCIFGMVDGRFCLFLLLPA